MHSIPLLSLVALIALTACVGTPESDAVDQAMGADDIDVFIDPDQLDPATLACSDTASNLLYEKRIAPLMREDRLDSCNTCHFAGVELRNFVRDTPCGTMRCMLEQGVADFGAPRESKILGWILRGEPDSGLITSDVVREEHDAFLEWIQYSSRCHFEVCAETQDVCSTVVDLIDPAHTTETLLAGCDEDDMVAAFTDKVWGWAERCSHCHSTENNLAPEVAELVPPWMTPTTTLDGPRRTMLNLLDLGAVDVVEPTQSRLLTKPLLESLGGIEHGGGAKIERLDDPSYVDFLAWIELYAACATDGEP